MWAKHLASVSHFSQTRRFLRRSLLTAARQHSLESPSLSWSSLQTMLEDAVPHVLIVLDCGYAANATGNLTASKTTKEILAACSRECPRLSGTSKSYTSAIVDEITHIGSLDSDRERVSAAMLHSRLMSIKGRLFYTPIYTLLSENGGSSIVLAPKPAMGNYNSEAPSASSMTSTQTTASQEVDVSRDALRLSQSSSQSSFPTQTRVLIAVSFEDDLVSRIPNVSEWNRWLTTGAPLEIQSIDVRMENSYNSYSQLVIFSLPIVVWTRLRENSAYRFVGYIKAPGQIHKIGGFTVQSVRDKSHPAEGYQSRGTEFRQELHEHLQKEGLDVNKDICTVSYPRDCLGRNPATPVTMLYTTPEQWAECSPVAAEAQRQRAQLLFPEAKGFLSTLSSIKYLGRSPKTVWFCVYSDCPYRGSYPTDLYADCVLGCRRERHPNSRTMTTSSSKPEALRLSQYSGKHDHYALSPPNGSKGWTQGRESRELGLQPTVWSGSIYDDNGQPLPYMRMPRNQPRKDGKQRETCHHP